MMSVEDQQVQPRVLIVDNGSAYLKAGFSDQESPQICFPNRVAYERIPSILARREYDDAHIGNTIMDDSSPDPFQNAGYIVYSPIEYGIITRWEDMEHIWRHTFYNELQLEEEEEQSNHVISLLLTEPPNNPKANRERMARIMFETFPNVSTTKLYIQTAAVLSLYASGRTMGCVLDSGEGVTHAVPIYEGYIIPHAVVRLELGGKDVTDYLVKLLSVETKGYESLLYTSARKKVQSLKEEFCYVAEDYESEKDEVSLISKSFDLVSSNGEDGTTTGTMDIERIQCPEILFQPKLLLLSGRDGNEELDGIPDIIVQSINKCDDHIRQELFANIVLAGGNTMFPGFSKRLTMEVKARLQQQLGDEQSSSSSSSSSSMVVVAVEAPPQRQYSAWMGGSLLASLPSFQNEWITRQDFEEVGGLPW